MGLAPGVPKTSRFAGRFAEDDCQVLVPAIINRHDTFSGIPGIGSTNDPHREWLYRMAFAVGWHVIGYEIQKRFAVIDWFIPQNTREQRPTRTWAHGEGGLLPHYSAALDPRISATVVIGYFSGAGRGLEGANLPLRENTKSKARERSNFSGAT